MAAPNQYTYVTREEMNTVLGCFVTIGAAGVVFLLGIIVGWYFF